jgi:hypothetical protein
MTLPEIIDECNSFCGVDAYLYCEEQRTIEVSGIEITGSCRAFARQENVDGFSKCESFCKIYGRDSTICNVGGEADSNCDGFAD